MTIVNEYRRRSELDRIPADRQMVDYLYDKGKISIEARCESLSFLYPRSKWAALISRFSLIIGCALILSGIAYFFAFNWSKIAFYIKFSIIEIAIITCVFSAYFCSLNRISGNLLLLSGSVLVGVFLIVFSQVYQTGADSYKLFMFWALLTLGWTVVSNFPAQWVFWIAIVNFFVILWWKQYVLPRSETSTLILAYLTILNGLFWFLREYFVIKKLCTWLDQRWTRVLPAITTLLIMFIAAFVWIENNNEKSAIGGALGLVGHLISYFFYRYLYFDMLILSTTVISGCVITESCIFKILSEKLSDEYYSWIFFSMTIITMIIFSLSIFHLNKVFSEAKGHDIG
ncbi:DUF2157 domain-containing protein [Candidatus Ichthyocystis hellenicum]|uniref:DUF2157 domain-containing protein n=1 Tax=Candidatus Ichthyocystis hellenicum TaxID=1561003 RepID=UPI000AA3AAC2|nr:DUF2157 domain-containing protein [Candidatus Ichthyocystis hellenicum]